MEQPDDILDFPEGSNGAESPTGRKTFMDFMAGCLWFTAMISGFFFVIFLIFYVKRKLANEPNNINTFFVVVLGFLTLILLLLSIWVVYANRPKKET